MNEWHFIPHDKRVSEVPHLIQSTETVQAQTLYRHRERELHFFAVFAAVDVFLDTFMTFIAFLGVFMTFIVLFRAFMAFMSFTRFRSCILKIDSILPHPSSLYSMMLTRFFRKLKFGMPSRKYNRA